MFVSPLLLTVLAPLLLTQAGADSTPVDGQSAQTQMPWQRTLEDALALSRSTQKPLLVCVNMDGEMASESMARGRYRDPRFVALASGFIPVLASPNRHSDRDHDRRGRRIPDPRFGRLIESEHITIEPTLYERYFNGRRVAPRHVGVAPDGTILFDLYLLGDLSTIDRTLREYGKFDVAAGETSGSTDRFQVEQALLADPDAAARDRLEAIFLGADEATRARLAARALSPDRNTQHPELIRLALSDPSASVRLGAASTLR